MRAAANRERHAAGGRVTVVDQWSCESPILSTFWTNVSPTTTLSDTCPPARDGVATRPPRPVQGPWWSRRSFRVGGGSWATS